MGGGGVLCFGVEILNFATGEPGRVQGRDRAGIVEGSCGYRAVFGGNSFYREARVQDGGSPCG